MKEKIRLEGVYDGRTVAFMQDKGIWHAGFDFRPRSFNFLQQYRFQKILQDFGRPMMACYLHFANEKDFVVDKIVGDLSAAERENIFLEFSDERETSYYERFKLPYFWHYDPLKEFQGGELLAGFVLPFSLIEEYHQQGRFDDFVAQFFQVLRKSGQEQNARLILSMDWDSNIFPGLYEYFDFDIISLPINNKVELSWRQVNQESIEKNLRLLAG